ncbi:glycosyltransferase family 4 protein [Variovorax sp. J22R24]|uniref:glycosyltransferase family 4 protein n=1 Tax=Variovorax gracilis TaxID=3053502 RepID=UPI0025781517|nr:glycosyltransferase family 4 protein [Variovorax sp. J22R24]MDM0103692.1 glycosyltransferase family 4 protein [Variovorax sp. J22R24]
MIASYADSLLGFRAPLIAALQAKGLEVHVAAPALSRGSAIRETLEDKGLKVHEVQMQRTGTSPVADLKSLGSLFALMLRVRPDFVLGYTIKPVIYGSLAAWLARVPKRFALITGLGYAFQADAKRAGLQSLVRRLYALALANVDVTFFQNPDDQALFLNTSMIQQQAKTVVVNGSGVDVAQFSPAEIPTGTVRFVLIARLLRDKGVREYAHAARLVRKKHPSVQFDLVGWIDENPSAIAQAELDQWTSEGTIHFLGRLSDVRPAIANCSVFVLPSYREGTPRTVLEAMAMGRAVITTDAPGCRETVVNGDNGYLVPVQCVDALEKAMLRFVESPELINKMGQRGRQMAEEKYDVHKVNAEMLRKMGIA